MTCAAPSVMPHERREIMAAFRGKECTANDLWHRSGRVVDLGRMRVVMAVLHKENRVRLVGNVLGRNIWVAAE